MFKNNKRKTTPQRIEFCNIVPIISYLVYDPIEIRSIIGIGWFKNIHLKKLDVVKRRFHWDTDTQLNAQRRD